MKGRKATIRTYAPMLLAVMSLIFIMLIALYLMPGFLGVYT